MTDAPGGYLPPSDRGLGNGSESYATSAPVGTSSTSRTDTAKEQAGQLGQSAKESGAQVASTAADQAKNVAQEGRRQAQDLTRQARSQMTEQAGAQKDKATTGLRTISDELRSLAQGDSEQQPGPVADLAHQAADKVGDMAQWLETREPGQLVEEFRGIARRKPGTFLIGAAVAGVLVGRLTRGAVQAAKEGDSSAGGTDASGAPSYASSSAMPSSGSFAGETYPADSGAVADSTYDSDSTPIAAAAEADVIVVEDERVSSGSYGAGQPR